MKRENSNMIKCIYCGKDVEKKPGRKVVSVDGDFVCSDECHKKFHRRIGRICNMDDSEFEKWMLGEKLGGK